MVDNINRPSDISNSGVHLLNGKTGIETRLLAAWLCVGLGLGRETEAGTETETGTETVIERQSENGI